MALALAGVAERLVDGDEGDLQRRRVELLQVAHLMNEIAVLHGSEPIDLEGLWNAVAQP